MNLYSIIALILSLTTFAIAMYILSQGLSKNLNRAFFTFSFIVFLNQFGHFLLWSEIGISSPLAVIRYDAISWGFIGISACDISFAMTKRKYGWFFKISFLISAAIVMLALFTDVVTPNYKIYPWGIQPIPTPGFDIAHGFSVGVLTLIAVSNVGYGWFKTTNQNMKSHLYYFLIGALITFIVSLATNILLSGKLQDIPQIGSLTLSVILGYVLYSMFKFEFLHERVESTTKLIFKDAHEVIIIFNSNFDVIYLNDIAKRYFKSDKAIGDKVYKLIPDFELKLHESQEKTMIIKNKEIVLNLTVSRYKSTLSSPIYILLARDVTAKKTLMKMEYERQKAEEVGNERSRFIANIQHEFMTPMHSILNFSRFGLKKAQEEKSLKYFKLINESGEMLHNLLADLIEIAKIESGRQEYNYKDYDIRETIALATNQLSEKFKEKYLSLKTYVTSCDPIVTFDSKMIIKALNKIFQNAIKYSNTNTDIIIVIEDSELMIDKMYESTKISIKDYGTVIPKSEVEAVFTSFYESSNTQTNAGGIGVGLALCKKLITEHHGTITAYSNYDENSTTIELNIPKYYNKQTVKGNTQETNLKKAS